MKTNLGLLFNKEYFKALTFDQNNNWSMQVNNNDILRVLKEKIDNDFSPSLGNQGFILKTTYPGLLSGSGYNHEVGKVKGEFRLGFYFDHTTGLPVIPGSSIKGVLKYACEVRDGEYLKDILKRIGIELDNFSTEVFVNTVFEGKNKDEGISIYHRDIFLDAFPIKSENTLFGEDYITPHKEELKNPEPIKFLRVNPEVVFQFNFKLVDSNELNADQKSLIFREIIMDLGLGAKTNVGYGQFVGLNKDEKQSTKKQEYKAYAPSAKPIPYKKNDEVLMTIIELGEYVTLEDEVGSIFMKSMKNVQDKFEKVLKRKQKENRDIQFKDLEVGMVVKIRFGKDLNSENTNFSVVPENK